MPSAVAPVKLAGVIALLAPGRARRPPACSPRGWRGPGRRESLARWSAAAGLDLERLGTTADAEEIRDTAVTQPLVVATALLAHAALPPRRCRRTCRRRALGRRAGRRRGRRRADPGRGRRVRRGARAGDGRGVRAGADRHVRGARREARRGARPPRGAGPHSRQPQRRRPDRRRRPSTPSRRSPTGRPRGPGSSRCGRRRVPHPVHGPGGGGAAARTPPSSSRPTRVHAAVQRGRRRRGRRGRRAAPARRAGHPARALGLLPGDAARAGGDGADRAAAGRHAGRAGQTRAAGSRRSP